MPSKVTLAPGANTNSPTNGPHMNSSDQRSSGSYFNEGSDQGLKRKCVQYSTENLEQEPKDLYTPAIN